MVKAGEVYILSWEHANWLKKVYVKYLIWHFCCQKAERQLVFTASRGFKIFTQTFIREYFRLQDRIIVSSICIVYNQLSYFWLWEYLEKEGMKSRQNCCKKLAWLPILLTEMIVLIAWTEGWTHKGILVEGYQAQSLGPSNIFPAWQHTQVFTVCNLNEP